MGTAKSRAAARLTEELARCGVPVADRDAVAHVDWDAQRIDWSAAARPKWLLHGAPRGPELLSAERTLLLSVVSRVQAELDRLIIRDVAALGGRGGLEIDWV
jgi:hypothetical protein